MLFGRYVNKYYLKYGIFFLIGFAGLIAVDIIQTYVPEYLGQIVDMFNQGPAAIDKDVIMDIVGHVMIIALVMFLGRVIWRLSIFKAATGIELNIRREMYQKAERLSQRFYHENKVGNILNWFTTDIETVEQFFGWGTIMLVDAFFMSVFTMYKMFKLNITLSLVASIPVVLIIIWGALVHKVMGDKWKLRQEAEDRLYDFSQENFSGIRVIKAFVKENMQIHAFSKVARKNKERNITYARFSVIFDVIISIIIACIVSIILGVGGYIIYCNVSNVPIIIFGNVVNLSTGELVTFIGLFDILIWPLMALGQIFSQRGRAKASLNRINVFLDQEEEIKNPENAVVLTDVQGGIKFNHFSFKYPDGNLTSLEDLTFEIKPGETIGIIGKIGSGKTTLVNSLLRLYNIENNAIEIDGIDLMQCDIKSLRENISYVPQDNFLFSDKISSNIAFSNREAKFTDIKNAAIFADVDSNITSFKEGYDTISGERGVTLSGGQKQRIAIARAYLKNAPIMILDDSVSAVDVKTEETILHNIKEKRKGKTTIIVASRISTVSSLDRILVLDNGKLEAFDSHDNLLKISPTYKKLVYLQQLEKEVEGGHK